MDIVFRDDTVKRARGPELLNPSQTFEDNQGTKGQIASDHDVARILESQPTIDELSLCLQWLLERPGSNDQFNVRIPSPRSARILNILTTTTIANFWHLLRSDISLAPLRKSFTRCLRSIPGIGALETNIRSLTRRQKLSTKQLPEGSPPGTELSLLLSTREVLDQVIAGPKTISEILDSTLVLGEGNGDYKSLWKQALPLLSGGRMLTTLAEVDGLLRNLGREPRKTSFGNGQEYAAWLGRNIRYANANTESDTEDKIPANVGLFGRALSLGFTAELVESVFQASLHGDEKEAQKDLKFLGYLKPYEQQHVVHAILGIASSSSYRETREAFIPGFAAMLHWWCHSEAEIIQVLTKWIVGVDRGRTHANIMVHRSIIAALAPWPDTMIKLCDDLMSNFGDKLYIQNGPILQQEMHARDLLLIIGRLFKSSPSTIHQLAKSSVYINAISNRIAASASRPQFLGMVLAIAISELVDDERSRVKFRDLISDHDDLETFISLLKSDDLLGSLEDLKPSLKAQEDPHSKTPISDSRIKNLPAEKIETSAKKILTQSTDSCSESDLEDDATVSRRNKPTPPVYIRELLLGLRDTENHERFKICLSSAADLIRRKASFGSEVQEHMDELASELTGAKDALNDRNFANAQLNAMIALIIARPEKMGQWFSRSLFAGDYSISQRMAILSSLALAARELGGFRSENNSTLESQTFAQESFPSKRLPTWQTAFSSPTSQPTTPVDAIALSMNKSILQPMAASAADQLTGPESLKVRTFSSRLKGEKKAMRVIQNNLSKIVADSFFHPLTDRFRLEMETRGSVSSFSTPILLAHYLKTLALILHAAGPNTLSLPALSADLITLCLAPRLRAGGLEHLPVLDALLFCFLTVLDINSLAEKDLVTRHGSDLLEIKSWVEMVLERVDSGDSEHERVNVLAAGVLLKCSEVINRYQQEIVSKMAEFI